MNNTDFLIKISKRVCVMKKKIFLIVMFVFTFFGFYNVKAIMLYNKELNSESVYVLDKNTEMPIIEKNIKQRRSPASLTKIMTFIVAYENAKDINKDKVAVKQSVLDRVDPESSGVKLKAGEEVAFIDLLKCMLVSSSGYAAMVIADYCGGESVENFVNLMNSKAESLGCENTHFVNPDGTYDEGQYSTAEDIYKITRYAMKNPVFLNIVSTAECNIFGDERDPVITTNKMMDPKRGGEYYYPYVKGIKTGYLSEAGRCLVSYAEKGENSYVSVVMGGPDIDYKGNKTEKNMAMIDTKNIYMWAFENLKTIKMYDSKFPVSEINLGLVWKHDKLLLTPESDFFAFLPANFDKNDVTIKTHTPESIDAPIHKGDVVGSAEVFYKGEKIGSFNLVSSETFKKNYFLVIFRFIKNIVASPLFIIIFTLLLAFCVLYIIMAFRANKRRKRRSKIKRFSINQKNRR